MSDVKKTEYRTCKNFKDYCGVDGIKCAWCEEDAVRDSVRKEVDRVVDHAVREAVEAERGRIAKMFDGPVWGYDYREIAKRIRSTTDSEGAG